MGARRGQQCPAAQGYAQEWRISSWIDSCPQLLGPLNTPVSGPLFILGSIHSYMFDQLLKLERSRSSMLQPTLPLQLESSRRTLRYYILRTRPGAPAEVAVGVAVWSYLFRPVPTAPLVSAGICRIYCSLTLICCGRWSTRECNNHWLSQIPPKGPDGCST